MGEFEFFASCLPGFEEELASELSQLHIKRVRPLGGGVAFFGDAVAAERACLWSRMASRVMLVVGRASARDAEALYRDVRAFPWEDVLARGASMAVRVHGTNAELRNTQFTALKVKDAVCDRMREACGARPDVDAHDPDVLIEVRVRNARASVSVDLAGESLHRRPYFDGRDGDDAALSCAHAAGVLASLRAGERLREGWGLVDPASDAGYVVVEAAGMACDLAPNLLRERWGFTGWAAHDAAAWDDMLAEADDRFACGLDALLAESGATSAKDAPNTDRVRIVGLSSSSPSIARARDHLRAAGLRAVASIEVANASDVAEVVERVGSAVECLAFERARAAGAAAEGATSFAAEAADQPCALMVAHAAAIDRDDDARAVAETAAFVTAASHAPDGSAFGFIGAHGVEARFGASPALVKTVGRGRVEAQLERYDVKPPAPARVNVANPRGGADLVVEVSDERAGQFAARLRKMARERRKWAAREGVSCYRVYDADLPEYNVAVDVYEGALDAAGKTFVYVAEYKAPSSVDQVTARRRFDDVLAIVPAVLDVRPDHVFSKVRERSKGGSQYAGAGRRSYVTYTEEAGCVFEIDLAGYLDTGLFLDHRLTRGYVGELAADKRFLNLFAYTGTATVHAAAGGAARTTTVDLSQTYLEWAQRNMRLNGFLGGGGRGGADGRGRNGRRGAFGAGGNAPHEFVRADVMRWIQDARRRNLRYDLVFVDPPTFSNSKSMGSRTWDVQRDHVELLIGVSRLLAQDGMAVFSCNLRSFKPDAERLAHYGVVLEDVTESTIPHDFERNKRIHQCYLVRRER